MLVITIPFTIDAVDALYFNINSGIDDILKDALNEMFYDNQFWEPLIDTYNQTDPDLIDSCIECIKEQDIDIIWKYIKPDINTIKAKDYDIDEEHIYINYTIMVYWDFDALCEKVFHQKL